MKKITPIVLLLVLCCCTITVQKPIYKTTTIPTLHSVGYCDMISFVNEGHYEILNELAQKTSVSGLIRVPFDFKNKDNTTLIAEACKSNKLDALLIIHPRLTPSKYVTSNVDIKLYDSDGELLCFINKQAKGKLYPAIGESYITKEMEAKITDEIRLVHRKGVIAAWESMAAEMNWIIK